MKTCLYNTCTLPKIKQNNTKLKYSELATTQPCLFLYCSPFTVFKWLLIAVIAQLSTKTVPIRIKCQERQQQQHSWPRLPPLLYCICTQLNHFMQARSNKPPLSQSAFKPHPNPKIEPQCCYRQFLLCKQLKDPQIHTQKNKLSLAFCQQPYIELNETYHRHI